jgi:hypothetical protein
LIPRIGGKQDYKDRTRAGEAHLTKTEPQAHSFWCGPLTKTRFKYPINPEWQISFSIGIDPQEVFPSKAPITKAVIEIRANTETEWAEELITPRPKGEIFRTIPT